MTECRQYLHARLQLLILPYLEVTPGLQRSLFVTGDNQGSIFIASIPVTEKRLKHIDICYHYIHEVVDCQGHSHPTLSVPTEVGNQYSTPKSTLLQVSNRTWGSCNHDAWGYSGRFPVQKANRERHSELC